MRPEELERIEKRCNAATEGPWTLQCGEHIHKGKIAIYGGSPGGRIDIALIQPWMTHEEANASFITHAREDVPALIAEIRSLRTEAAMNQLTLTNANQTIEKLETIAAATLEKITQGNLYVCHDCDALYEYGRRGCIGHRTTPFVSWFQTGGEKLLKRLQTSEKVCETLEGMHLILGNDCGPLVEEWRKARDEY